MDTQTKSSRPVIKLGVRSLILPFIFSLAALIVFFSTWNLHFRLIYNSSKALFIILAIWSFVPLIIFTLNAFIFGSKKLNVLSLILAVVTIFEHVALLAYALSKLYYLIIEAAPYMLIIICGGGGTFSIISPKIQTSKGRKDNSCIGAWRRLNMRDLLRSI